MTRLSELAWNVSEEEYRKNPAYSYSTLAKFAREGFSKLDTLYDRVDTPSLTFGSVVDCLVTETREEFDRRFMVADFPQISDSQYRIVEYLFASYGNQAGSLKELDDNIIIQATEELQFQLNWKPQTRAKVIKENCSEYWNLKYLAGDRKIISQDEYDDAVKCVDALKSTPAVAALLFQEDPFSDTEGFWQLKFRTEFEGILVRCMFDRILVDHKNRTIIPIDLKTSSHKEYEFPESFIQWKYYIQANLYSWILRKVLKDTPYADYEIQSYAFVVVNRFSLKPLVWRYSQVYTAEDIGLGDRWYRNWPVLLRELHYYESEHSEYPIYIGDYNSIEKYLERKEDYAG